MTASGPLSQKISSFMQGTLASLSHFLCPFHRYTQCGPKRGGGQHPGSLRPCLPAGPGGRPHPRSGREEDASRKRPMTSWCPLLSVGFPPGCPKTRFPGSHPPAGPGGGKHWAPGPPAGDRSLGRAVLTTDQGTGCARVRVRLCTRASAVRLCVCVCGPLPAAERGLDPAAGGGGEPGCLSRVLLSPREGAASAIPGRTGAPAGGRQGPGPGDCGAPPTLAPERSLSHCPVGSALGHRAPLIPRPRAPVSSPLLGLSPPPFPEPLSGLQLPEPQRQHIRASLAQVPSFLKS